jgi:hypothetical protein
MQAHYEAPPFAHEVGSERLVQSWLHFLRSTDAIYQRVADERGEPYQSPEAEALTTVAQMAATLGVEPAEAVGRLPAWCVWRSHLTNRRLRNGGSTAEIKNGLPPQERRR